MKKYRKICCSLILSIVVIAGTMSVSTLKVQAGSVSLLPVLTSTAYNSDNIFTISGYKGQCTWFVYGRVLEKLGIKLPAEFYGNALTWYSRNITDKVYDYGSQPKADSIAVWSGGSAGGGHVGYVEKVVGDSVYFNEANFSIRGEYQGHLEVLSKEAMLNRGNIFLIGYIYPTEKYNTSNFYGQVTLVNSSSRLNVRSGAGVSYSIIGSLPDKANVTIIEKSGSWYKIKYGSSTGFIYDQYVTIT